MEKHPYLGAAEERIAVVMDTLERRKKRVERIITDNTEERIRIIWDGTRFILVQDQESNPLQTIIILNPREMMDIIQFASNLGGK